MARIRRKLGTLGWSMIVLAMGLWTLLPLASLAIDAVLYVEGVTPENPVNLDGKGTTTGIAVEGFSWASEQSVATDAGGGGTRVLTVPAISSLKVVRAGPDGASAQLLQRHLLGNLISSAILRVGALDPKAAPGGDFRIELTNVIIKAVEYSGGLSDPRESIELVGGQVRVVDLSTGEDAGWNLESNEILP